MLIDGIMKVVFVLWLMALSGYAGYCLGLTGINKSFWKEFLNGEEEEDDEEC